MTGNRGRALVTGGTGYIGSRVANALAEAGYETTALDIAEDAHGWLAPHVAFLRGDVRDEPRLRESFKGVRFVFHCAALPRVQYSIEHPEETHETNVTGTLNVLLAAQKEGVGRVVYSASSSAYGDSATLPLREDMPARPKSPYALQKYAGELYCRLFSDIYGLSTVSLRYFNVYGPGEDPQGAYALVIPKFLAMRKEGKTMTVAGDGTQTRDFTHVSDVVRANLLAAEGERVGRGEVINVGAGRNVSVNRVAELIGGPVTRIAPRLEPHDTLADNARAKELLGWEPAVSLEDGIVELKALAGLP